MKTLLKTLYACGVIGGFDVLGIGSLNTLLITPFIFFTGIIAFHRTGIPKIFLFALLIAVYGFLISIRSLDIEHAVDTQLKMLVIIMEVFNLYYLLKIQSLNFRAQFFIFVLPLLVSAMYLYTEYGFTFKDRVLEGDGMLNANTYGYFSFMALLFLYRSKPIFSGNQFFYQLIVYICVLLALYNNIISASRAGFLVSSLMSCLLIFKDIQPNWRFLFVLIIATFFAPPVLKEVQRKKDEITLVSRYAAEYNDETFSPRRYHINMAFEVFKKNPVFGVGPGGYALQPKAIEQGSFTHNTYLEFIVNYGLVGCVILIIAFLNWYAYSNSSLYLVPSFLLLVYANFYVIYLSPVFFNMLPLLSKLQQDR